MAGSDIITTTAALEALCKELAPHSTLCLDTEFIRERSFWPKLCLVQIGAGGISALIDPLAPGMSLEPLFTLFKNPNQTKIFHAGRQDLEVFYYLSGSLPAPIFDTQIAAAFCGYGDQIAYDRLVQAITGTTLHKGAQFTDWARRPLSDQQLRYASADVEHLPALYDHLSTMLRDSGRLAWAGEEMQAMLNPKIYVTEPEEAWKKLRLKGKDGRYLAALQCLAAWRENTARTVDKPRQRILKDDLIQEIAMALPESIQALRQMRLYQRLPNNQEEEVLGVIKQVKALPKESLPSLPKYVRGPMADAALVALLKVLLQQCAQSAGLASRLLASSDDIDDIACGNSQDNPAMNGWRYELFGKQAEALMRGETALSYEKGKVKVTAVKAAAASV